MTTQLTDGERDFVEEMRNYRGEYGPITKVEIHDLISIIDRLDRAYDALRRGYYPGDVAAHPSPVAPPSEAAAPSTELADNGTMFVCNVYKGQPYDEHTFTANIAGYPAFVVTGIQKCVGDGYLLHNPAYPNGVGVSPFAELTYKRNAPQPTLGFPSRGSNRPDDHQSMATHITPISGVDEARMRYPEPVQAPVPNAAPTAKHYEPRRVTEIKQGDVVHIDSLNSDFTIKSVTRGIQGVEIFFTQHVPPIYRFNSSKIDVLVS